MEDVATLTVRDPGKLAFITQTTLSVDDTADIAAALKARFNAKSLDGLSVPASGLNGDIHASPDYRAHLIGVMAKRAVNKALGK